MRPHSCYSRALGWIEALAGRLEPRSGSLSTAQTLYVAAAVCGDADSSSRDDARAALSAIRTCLAGSPAEAWGAGSGAKTLLCCLIDRAFFVDALPALEEYSARAATAVETLSRDDLTEDLLPAALLLRRLGAEVPLPRSSPMSFGPTVDAMVAGEETIRGLANKIESATHFGIVEPSASAEDGKALGVVLEAHLVRALSDHDLEYAAALLRALVYLERGPTLAMRTGVSYLRSCQADDGHFGFFDREIRALRARDPEPLVELGLLAPTLLGCLWALAESEGRDYRLYRDLARVETGNSSIGSLADRP